MLNLIVDFRNSEKKATIGFSYGDSEKVNAFTNNKYDNNHYHNKSDSESEDDVEEVDEIGIFKIFYKFYLILI